jgi:hypothetical protein
MRHRTICGRIFLHGKQLLVLSGLVVLFVCASGSFRPLQAQITQGVEPLLSRTRALVEQFVTRFGLLRYEEDVVQQKIKVNDKVDYSRETVFDSIVRMNFDDGRLHVDEQRLTEKQPAHVDARPLMSTTGFSTLAMIFHPYYAGSFSFTREDDEAINGKLLARIRFEHIPGKPSPILYQVINADRPLELSGTAWIDAVSGEIYRIEATAGAGLGDMGLKEIRAQITYGPFVLHDEAQPQWLPVSATIDLATPRQHWRNIHHFQDYRKYRVAVNFPGADQ